MLSLLVGQILIYGLIYSYSDLSMNVDNIEYSIIVDILLDEDDPIGPDVIEPSSKRRKANVMEVYTWKYVENDGKTLLETGYWFLDKATCYKHGQDNHPDNTKEDSKFVVDIMEMSVPSAVELVSQVYHYILANEFGRRFKEKCYGCIYNRPGQEDHMSAGCLDDKEALVDIHARYCHLCISTPRLQEACDEMLKHYKMDQYMASPKIDYKLFVTCLKNADPKKYLMCDADFFFYEFCHLDDM